MNLPFDIARCVGTTAPLCQICRRQEPGDPINQKFIEPAWTRYAVCVNFIPPKEKK